MSVWRISIIPFFTVVQGQADTRNYAEDVDEISYWSVDGIPSTDSLIAWNEIWEDTELSALTCWPKHEGDAGGSCSVFSNIFKLKKKYFSCLHIYKKLLRVILYCKTRIKGE